MDESQSQKGRTEKIFVNFYLSLDVPFFHCSAHPFLLVSWDSFVCVVSRDMKDNVHVLPKKKQSTGSKFAHLICTFLWHNFHRLFF